MREIKFRAWDKFEGMLYSNNDCVITPAIFGWDDFNQDHYGRINKMKKVKNGIGWFVTGHSGKLMQFTGLRDKNGKEIYEGDIINARIVLDSLLTMGEIVFDDHFLFYANKNLSGNTPLFKLDSIEVIGNIYENPELLTKNGED